jgi:hypothetical protein
MKSIRIKAWTHDSKGTHLAEGVKGLVPNLPCAFTKYELEGDDGQGCSVDVFPGSPGIALIPPDAPAWADEAIRKHFD